MFGDEEINMMDGREESGNFHVRAAQKEQYENAATEGHFAPLIRRVEKIDQSMNDIIAFQEYEREQENLFKDY